ncbi:MAG: hypothetical protein ACP5RE_03775 [Candidatus Acidifodinimicrobium sp.]
MTFKQLLQLGLVSIMVLTLILMSVFATPINEATKWQIGILVLMNVVTAGTGILRVHRVRPDDPDFKSKTGKAAAEHSWLILSVTTAVLALAFGKAFQVNLLAMVIQSLFLSIITVLTIFLIVEVARQKITFLD